VQLAFSLLKHPMRVVKRIAFSTNVAYLTSSGFSILVNEMSLPFIEIIFLKKVGPGEPLCTRGNSDLDFAKQVNDMFNILFVASPLVTISCKGFPGFYNGMILIDDSDCVSFFYGVISDAFGTLV